MGRGKFEDLTGKRFERLEVIQLHCFNKTPNGTKKAIWKCKCDCGNIIYTCSGELNRGNSKSCGCLHRELLIKAKTKNPQEVMENDLYTRYISSAKKRKYDFSLTKREFITIIYSSCFYCGKPPLNLYKHSNNYDTLLYNGIDRVNNSKGYSIDNSVPCCWRCNKFKSNLNQEEFLTNIFEIYDYLVFKVKK